MTSVHQATCTRTTEYLVPEVKNKCLCFVNDHMTRDDVCPFLDYIHTMCEEHLDSLARTFITKYSLGVIGSSIFSSFTEITVTDADATANDATAALRLLAKMFRRKLRVIPSQSTFRAHKMILAVQNDVFKAMFYGDFAKEDRIVITDLHPDGVRGLLRYFYSGNLEVANAHQAACTRTAAAKYLVPKLEEKCLSFVNARMGPMDVCPFLDYILTMSEDELDSPAKALIRRDTRGVIGARNFPRSTERTVRYILRYATNVPEAIVVESVYDWAKQQWLTHFFEDDQRPDIRASMLPLFPELRFLALTATEFVQGPIAWKIFTDAEALAILSNIVKGRSMAMPEGFSKIRKNRA
ncbi:hypothetical protein HPB51_017269 [Rhipicephalus microplus]|uniref:BTB domain-containing protein n=1 Tax=Rhipicephalus microplus TaxID=6941 RepID=A0A9J6ETM9_RHIMP|nr:hypothetical protein HPB51_017269 [Rhipicephalus microplus]